MKNEKNILVLDENGALMETNLPIGIGSVTRGKVRDIYDLGGGRLLIITTDRLSAFDVIMKSGIPYKGKVLNQLSIFWFNLLSGMAKNHIISTRKGNLPSGCPTAELEGRFMICQKLDILPVECVVRGYLAGSGWKDYQATGSICGVKLPAGLKQCEILSEPIFTPATKAKIGDHDENISFEDMCVKLRDDRLAELVVEKSIAIYQRAHEHAKSKGIILADTKFEWALIGETENELILADEMLTPDSSRFWPADKYEAGRDQESFDKQFVRNYLEEINFDKSGPGIELPPDIVEKTSAKYVDAYEKMTGRPFRG